MPAATILFASSMLGGLRTAKKPGSRASLALIRSMIKSAP